MRARRARTITVVGSINVDLVVHSARLPRPGETVIGGELSIGAGGKGANQAVAAARLGADVRMVGCVGDDEHGRLALAALSAAGVDIAGVRTVHKPTGVALVMVDADGRNLISVAPGANADTRAEGRHDILLMQLETPFHLPRAQLVILNPAPARRVPLVGVDVVVPNEHEAEELTGETAPEAQKLALERMGAGRAIITRGARGVYDGAHHPAFEVAALDTVGAGDAFAGALAAALALEVEDPLRFAQAAAALSVTRRGAQSAPGRAEVEAFLAQRGAE